MRSKLFTGLAFLAAGLTLFLTGCASAPAQQQSKQPAWTPEQQEVIAVVEKWQKAWDTGDIATIDKMLPDQINLVSTSSVMVENSPAGDGVYKEKATYLASARKYKDWLQGTGSNPWSVKTETAYLDVKVAGADATVVRKNDWQMIGVANSPKRSYSGPISGVSTRSTSLKKMDGAWKIYEDVPVK